MAEKPLIVVTNDLGATMAQGKLENLRQFVNNIGSKDGAVNVKDLEDGSKLKEIGQEASQLITMGVGFLRDPNQFPNPVINELMADTWCIVGNRIVQPAMSPAFPVPTISFIAAGSSDSLRAYIFMPFNYAQIFKNNATSQFGALVYIGSQCRDFYNGQFSPLNSQDVETRALAYEAEYFRTLATLGPVVLDDYAKKVLDRFPEGIKSLDPALSYEPKQRPPET